jgi:hypothetical protein
MKRQHRVYLYDEPKAASLDLKAIREYVSTVLPPLDVVVRPGFVAYHVEDYSSETLDGLATQFAAAKVREPASRDHDLPPLPGEVKYERRRLADPANRSWGILYDGLAVMESLCRLIPREERSPDHIHVVFTNQLLGTWDEGDGRYHARVSIYGFPSLLSTTGIVEAPAKPREYYMLKQRYTSLGMQDAAAVGLDAEFRGRFIDHDDERLTDAMKGYVMQAIMHRLLGDPFCDDKRCRFYNAHWQSELIGAQLEGPYEFCPVHDKALRHLREEMGR